MRRSGRGPNWCSGGDIQIPPGENESFVIEGEAAAEPIGLRRSSGHDEDVANVADGSFSGGPVLPGDTLEMRATVESGDFRVVVQFDGGIFFDALVIETGSPGGQAASSSKIENYLGFPTGISGQELAARAIAQVEKFGARMMVAHSDARLDCEKRPYKVVLDNGNRIAARAVVIATGAQYNKPRIANLEKFEGQGVYYGATFMES